MLRTGFVILVIASSPLLFAGCQSQSDTRALREEVDSLKAVVAEIQALPQIQRWIAQSKPLDVDINVAGAPTLGVEDATLTLIEFSDYQCPFCGRHAANTMPALKEKYVETGKVKYVFFDFPVSNHKFAPKASEAAHCAGDQGKYWEMHDELFANRTKLQPENLPAYAANIGLDGNVFAECLDSGKYGLTVRKNTQIGKDQISVSGTPTFGLGYTSEDGKSVRVTRKIVGAKAIAAFEKEIEELLAARTAG